MTPSLRCPITGRRIHIEGSGADARCWSGGGDGGERIEFPLVRGQPVLVDFEKSILDRQAVLSTGAASPLPDRRTRRSAAKRALLGGNPVAALNAKRFLQGLRALSDGRPPRVLIVGGGTIGPGADLLYASDRVEIIAFDIYASPHTDFVADAHAIPLEGGAVDGVWIQAVLEHVLSPERVVSEIHRVLAPDGLVYAETPFLQPVHERAYDFTRFTELGHRWLFRRFRAIDSGVVAGPGRTLFQCLAYFVGGVVRNRRLGTLLALPFFWLRFVDRIVPREHASDAASGVFFLGSRSEEALEPHELPRAFKGVA